MLSDEAKQAISARLAGETNGEATTEDQAATEAQEAADTAVEAASAQAAAVIDGSDTQAVQPDPAPPPQQKPSEQREDNRTVPLHEVVKLREDRRNLREQLAKAEARAAKLEGYVAGRGSSERTGIPDIDALFEPEPKNEDVRDPYQRKVDEVYATVNEIQQARSQLLLDQVILDARTKDPTMPEGFLIDELASKKTPEQALQKWSQYKQAMGVGKVPPPVITPPPGKAAPPAPPVVRAAPSPGKSSKPLTFADVGAAIRSRMAGDRA